MTAWRRINELEMKPLEALRKGRGLTDRAAKALLDAIHGKTFGENTEAYLRRKGVGGGSNFDNKKCDELVAVYARFLELGKTAFWAEVFAAAEEVVSSLESMEQEASIYDGPTLPKNWSVNEKGQVLNQFGRVA